ncbi:hypothetical protein FRC09_003564 [Ceratobasidium sp. 395]|nr:hypothetical protein FRC09_003564 [Ceratobasidium sp. 395]
MDKVTCQMLLWLISNCEDSQLVDIALQSIAGARAGFPVEMFAEANVMELVVQRLNSCVVSNPITNAIRLKPATSIGAVALYAQALARLLEWDAGFRSSSERQVPQLNRKHLSDFFNLDTNMAASELENLHRGEDDNIATIATSIFTPLCHHNKPDRYYTMGEDFGFYTDIIQRRNDRLIRSHLNGGVAIDSRALLALLEAAPHWIIGQVMSMGIGDLYSWIMLLVQLVHSPACSAPDFQYAFGLSLTVAAVLVHYYPGWEYPSNRVDDRATRAIEVYRYYKVEHREEPRALVVSGLLGLLRGASKTPSTFEKNEVTILVDTLTLIGDFRSIADVRLHTLPDTLTIAQHAKITLLETLRAVADGRSDFGETDIIPGLMQLLDKVRAPSDLNMGRAAFRAFLSTRNYKLRKIFSKLLHEVEVFRYIFEDLESAQMNRLIDISLGDDAYSAPAAMSCLWNLAEWSIESANETPDGKSATAFADMLQHDALTSLRAKAPDLPVSPGNIFEVGLIDMWYPLLREMKRHKHAALILDKSNILSYMLDSDGVEDAKPYLELELRDERSWYELRDERSWYDILRELDDMGVEVSDSGLQNSGSNASKTLLFASS